MTIDAVADAVRPHVEAGVVPGAVVGLRRGGQVSLRALGTTTPGGSDPLRTDAVVRISSNTKPIVAALTLLLVQDGVVGLGDAVDEVVPELADRRVVRRLDGPVDDTVPAVRAPTVEDLLTMRMGLGFVVEGGSPAFDAAVAAGLGFGPPDPAGLPAPDEWIARLAALPLLDQPGTTWRYELSFAVLGVVLARAAGRPLPELLRERLLDPLGMADTGFVAPPDRSVPSFARSDDGLVLVDEDAWTHAPAFPDARGGLVSTAADLLRFAGMLLDDGAGLLSPASVAAMTADQLTPAQHDGPVASAFLGGDGWGYGLGVADGAGGRRYGWAGGLGTLWWTWPEQDTAAVLITQVMPPDGGLFDGFRSAVEGLPRRGTSTGPGPQEDRPWRRSGDGERV